MVLTKSEGVKMCWTETKSKYYYLSIYLSKTVDKLKRIFFINLRLRNQESGKRTCMWGGARDHSHRVEKP